MLAIPANWVSLKLKHETAVAAGVRRIEAVSGKVAEDYINQQFDTIHIIREMTKKSKRYCKVNRKFIG